MKYSERMKICNSVATVTAQYVPADNYQPAIQLTLEVDEQRAVRKALPAQTQYRSSYRLAEVICDFEDWVRYIEEKLGRASPIAVGRCALDGTINRL